MRSTRLTVYADLNCPFCYALHESLTASGYIDRVEWLSIEHAPQISFDTRDIQVQSELAAEVGKVKTLATDVTINVPSGRPNTHIANEVLTEIQHENPGKADAFRSLLYRALWIDSKDIADLAIIDELLKSIGINRPAISDNTQSNLQQWQQEWEQGDFSRNIPALLTAEGNKLLGLPSPQLLSLFIFGDSSNLSAEDDAICKLQPREKVLVSLADNALKQTLSTTLDEYEIQLCNNNQDAIDISLSPNPPDLIILDAQLDGYSCCRTISEHSEERIIPIILLTDNRDDAAEIKAFEMGATDFIHKNISPLVLKARTRTLLRLKRANDLLDEVAHMDPLTEIPNRREYDRVIDLEWRQSIRTQKPLSVILIDIDYFKNYNDNYGHIEGDKCLRAFASFLQCSIRRPTDIVARYGGEEFVIVLPDTDNQGAVKVAQQIKDKLQELDLPHAYSEIAKQITVSQGIATCTASLAEKQNNLIKAADHALYEAKGQGRNKIVSDTRLGE